jgi:hypothetical protein
MAAGAPPIAARPVAARPVAGAALSLGLIAATLGAWVSIPHAPGLDPLVVVTLWFNVLFAVVAIGIEASRRPYSLHLMHLIAMFLFLGVASVLQYSRGNLGVAGNVRIVQRQVPVAALATTLWLVSYVAVYELRLAIARKPRGAFLTRPLTLPRVILLGVMALAALVYLASVGLLGAATRGASETAVLEYSLRSDVGGLSNPLYVVTGNLVRSLPPVALMATLLVLIRNPRKTGIAIFPFVGMIGIGTLFVNNPFAASRMFFVCCLIAFATPFFLRRFRTSWLLVTLVLLGLAILPALGTSTVRLALNFREVLTALEVASPVAYLSGSSDVDSLGMTTIVQQYVDRFGHTWGRQMLGGFLFWFPRTFWPTKPIATGTLASRSLGFDFTNLAPPIISEPLVDFGLVGVPIVAGLFAWILWRTDAIYWTPGREGIAKTYRIIDVFYPFWLVAVVYHTRGDMFASMTFNVSFSLWMLPLVLGPAVRAGLPRRAPTQASAHAAGALGSASVRRVD